MLLDVGEGTIGQLIRCCCSSSSSSSTTTIVEGEEQQQRHDDDDDDKQRLLAEIMVVWISHPHADHHLGIIRLLQERRAMEPLILIAPVSILAYLDEYCQLDPRIQGTYIKMDCRDLLRINPTAQNVLHRAIGF